MIFLLLLFLSFLEPSNNVRDKEIVFGFKLGHNCAPVFVRFTIGLCYSISNGYALSSYLEYPFLVIQDILLVALVLHYNKQLGSTWFAAFGAYSAIVYAFTTGVFPRTVIVTLMVIGSVMFVSTMR